VTLWFEIPKRAIYNGTRFGGPGLIVDVEGISSVCHLVIFGGPYDGKRFICGLNELSTFERAVEEN
jgi:hypothetical protein